MKNIIIISIIFFSWIPAFVTAQNFVPNIPIEDSLDNEYVLPDVLQSGKNYLIEVSVNWCGWCRVELKDWKECHQEWEDNYNLEVFVLATDGTEPANKQNMIDWFIDEELEYQLYFANNDTVVNHLAIQNYPTNFLVNEQGIIVDTINGYQDCDAMSQIISNNFDVINSIDESKSIDKEITIAGFGGRLIVKHGELHEEIDLSFYTVDGRFISKEKNRRTDELIDIPEINGLVIVRVIGNNWVQSKIIKGK